MSAYNNVRCQENTEKFQIVSPIGNLQLTVCKVGLHSLEHTDDVTCKNFAPNMSVDVHCPHLTDSISTDVEKHAFACIEWLRTYFFDVKTSSVFSGFPRICTVSVTGNFRDKVLWALVKNVGVGETISYGKLGTLAATSSGAARAVGSAMANNPLPILFPCHRVIRNDGNVGQYAGGCKNFLKEWLLDHEGVSFKTISW